MELKVYNTLTKSKQEFIPADKKTVKIYVCGPTVYNYISIGNARPVIVFNMVRNYLEHLGCKVLFVQNITDIEDKIIKKANQEKVSFQVITQRYTEAFLNDLKSLGISSFAFMPKASEMIPEIISIIEMIVKNGYGYVSDGDVYFDVLKFKNYGRLSRQNVNEMLSSEEESLSKRNKIDFTLWKSAKPGEPCWDSPWGKGRPGWHIECSAMSIKYLDYGFDIHGGGIDLVFPHHENEIAQSEAAFPEKGSFVKYWMHNGMIEVKEEKMSKSKGLKDDWILKNLLNKYSANVIKMYMLSTHYRSPLEFSTGKLEEAKKAVEKIINFLRNVSFLIESQNGSAELKADKKAVTGELENDFDDGSKIIFEGLKQFKDKFKVAMDDDFNSAKAIGELFEFIRKVNSIIQTPDFKINSSLFEGLKMSYEIIINYSNIFGFNFEKEIKSLASANGNLDSLVLEKAEIEELIEQRNNARKQRDFKRADQIRDKLKSFGIVLEDRKEGTIWKREE